MCNNIISGYQAIECNPNLDSVNHNRLIVLDIKPYVYEIVNGKRKRSSPFEFDPNNASLITKIKPRAIRSKLK